MPVINTNCSDGLACFSFRLSRAGIKKATRVASFLYTSGKTRLLPGASR